MTPYIQRHLPLIAPRIEFSLNSPPPLPLIASRIEFTAERLVYCNRAQEGANGESNPERVDQRQHEDIQNSPLSYSDPVPGQPLSTRTHSNKVPKPVGEPGRPGSGGYCLETVLVRTYKWPKETFRDITESIRCIARKKLNMTVSYWAQNKEAIHNICEQMEAQWPLLKEYHGCWPICSMLKLTLKYQSEAARRTQTREMNTRLRAVLRGLSPENPVLI